MNAFANVPRSTLSFPLQREFVSNDNKCGDQLFSQVKRTGNVCIYKRTRLNGTVHGYEVFTVKTVKAGTAFPNGKSVEKDYEQYPGASSFGRTAWAPSSLERAEEIFDSLLNDKNDAQTDSPEEGSSPEVVPVKEAISPVVEGEFSKKSFAIAQGVSDAKAYQMIQELIERGEVKESRRVSTGGRGRPMVLYVKV